jgi:hypothetical protein
MACCADIVRCFCKLRVTKVIPKAGGEVPCPLGRYEALGNAEEHVGAIFAPSLHACATEQNSALPKEIEGKVV